MRRVRGSGASGESRSARSRTRSFDSETSSNGALPINNRVFQEGVSQGLCPNFGDILETRSLRRKSDEHIRRYSSRPAIYFCGARTDLNNIARQLRADTRGISLSEDRVGAKRKRGLYEAERSTDESTYTSGSEWSASDGSGIARHWNIQQLCFRSVRCISSFHTINRGIASNFERSKFARELFRLIEDLMCRLSVL